MIRTMDQGFIEQVYAALEYERGRDGPPAEFSQLPPIPADRYRDPEFLQLENEHLWNTSWLYACHAGQLPGPGSFVLWANSASPIVIVRGEDRIHADLRVEPRLAGMIESIGKD